MNTHRILGERTGSLPGPLMLVFVQIHGNEPAGYHAVREFFRAVDDEYLKNPFFDFRGKIVALRGNARAAELQLRFLEKDLNRSWTEANVERVFAAAAAELQAEDLELRENIELMRHYVGSYAPNRLVVLDLHTTSAQGGVFIIPSREPLSRSIALHMHAPVLHGFLDRLQGTTLHYFCPENTGIETASICFEAGQHDDPASVSHCVSAIISCFTAAGGFYPEDIETRHEEELLRESSGLPREGNLVYVHPVAPGDDFRMRPDRRYTNFEPIRQGELLAYNHDEPIHAPASGFILMPLYQKQGSDGFFIIEKIDQAGYISREPVQGNLMPA